jgi:hypothetical protein
VVDREAIAFSGIDVVEADLADDGGAHDPARLAAALESLV